MKLQDENIDITTTKHSVKGVKKKNIMEYGTFLKVCQCYEHLMSISTSSACAHYWAHHSLTTCPTINKFIFLNLRLVACEGNDKQEMKYKTCKGVVYDHELAQL